MLIRWIKSLLIVALFCSTFSACNPQNIEESSSPQSLISVQKVVNFMETNAEYEELIKSYNTICIDEKFDKDLNQIYFARIEYEHMWGTGLLKVEEEDGQIVKITKTGIGGNKYYFDYGVIKISQGEYIAAFCATHMGNGTLSLYPLEDIENEKYIIERAVDGDRETLSNSELRIDLDIDYEAGQYAADYFSGGKLNAAYQDVNGDGHTDILLEGLLYLQVKDEEAVISEKKYYCNYVYLYDTKQDQFIYSDIESERIEIFK